MQTCPSCGQENPAGLHVLRRLRSGARCCARARAREERKVISVLSLLVAAS